MQRILPAFYSCEKLDTINLLAITNEFHSLFCRRFYRFTRGVSWLCALNLIHISALLKSLICFLIFGDNLLQRQLNSEKQSNIAISTGNNISIVFGWTTVDDDVRANVCIHWTKSYIGSCHISHAHATTLYIHIIFYDWY